MNDEFEQDVFGLMDDLRGDNRVAVPDVGRIRRQAKKQQNRARAVVGIASLAVVASIGGGLWASNSESAESTFTSGTDRTPAVADDSAPTELRLKGVTLAAGSLDGASFGYWLQANSKPSPNGSISVAAIAVDPDPDLDGVRLNLSAFPLGDGSFEYFATFAAECGPRLSYGMIEFEDDLANFLRGRVPTTTNMAFGAVGYECSPRPAPAVLDNVLFQGFAVTIGPNRLLVSDGSDSILFVLVDSDGNPMTEAPKDGQFVRPSLDLECEGSSSSALFDFDTPLTSGATSSEEAIENFATAGNPHWDLRKDWHALQLASIGGNVAQARAIYVDAQDNTYLVLSARPIDEFWVVDGYESCSPLLAASTAPTELPDEDSSLRRTAITTQRWSRVFAEDRAPNPPPVLQTIMFSEDVFVVGTCHGFFYDINWIDHASFTVLAERELEVRTLAGCGDIQSPLTPGAVVYLTVGTDTSIRVESALAGWDLEFVPEVAGASIDESLGATTTTIAEDVSD